MDIKGKMEFKAISTMLSHQVRGHSNESRKKKNSTFAYAEFEPSSHLMGVACRV